MAARTGGPMLRSAPPGGYRALVSFTAQRKRHRPGGMQEEPGAVHRRADRANAQLLPGVVSAACETAANQWKQLIKGFAGDSQS